MSTGLPHEFFVRRTDLGERHYRCDTCGEKTYTLRDRMAHASLFRLPYQEPRETR